MKKNVAILAASAGMALSACSSGEREPSQSVERPPIQILNEDKAVKLQHLGVKFRDVVERLVTKEASEWVAEDLGYSRKALDVVDDLVDDQGSLTKVEARDYVERAVTDAAYTWTANGMALNRPALGLVDLVDDQGSLTKVEARDYVEQGVLLNATLLAGSGDKVRLALKTADLMDDKGSLTQAEARNEVKSALALGVVEPDDARVKQELSSE